MINLESDEGRGEYFVFNSVVDLLKSLLNAGDRSINDRRKSFLYRSEGKVNADSFLMHRQ
jgi:hypothetical protein